jgi:hypothetical protein
MIPSPGADVTPAAFHEEHAREEHAIAAYQAARPKKRLNLLHPKAMPSCQ